tara:strand:+ start:591 stop:929 length:339 start_codon:yes stop_codon:yes gene_type:complete
MEDKMKAGLAALMKGVPTAKKRQFKAGLKKLLDKANKEKGITGKPKGRSPSMVLGSSSKAGMQNKQKSSFNVKSETLKPGRRIDTGLRDKRRLKPRIKPDARMMKRGGKAKK